MKMSHQFKAGLLISFYDPVLLKNSISLKSLGWLNFTSSVRYGGSLNL